MLKALIDSYSMNPQADGLNHKGNFKLYLDFTQTFEPEPFRVPFSLHLPYPELSVLHLQPTWTQPRVRPTVA